MPTVDSHCHASRAWYEPVESLLHQMDRNGVEHAVLVQIQGQTDNSYQEECVRRYPGRFASVVLVDPASSQVGDELRRLVDRGASGVRIRATARSSGEDSLSVWRAAAGLGLAVSCAGSAHEFATDEFADLLRSLPELTIVLEHLAATNSPDADDAERAARLKAFELARFPNVYIKFQGFGEFCRRALPVREPFPFEEPIPPLLEQAFQAFGPRRMMWGSDFPPVSGREGYENALKIPMEHFASLSGEDRDLMFGGVALSVFPIRS